VYWEAVPNTWTGSSKASVAKCDMCAEEVDDDDDDDDDEVVGTRNIAQRQQRASVYGNEGTMEEMTARQVNYPI